IIRPLTKVTDGGLLEKVEEIKTKLLSMNAAQAAIHLAQINDIFEGTGTVIDIKLPTEAQTVKISAQQRVAKEMGLFL
ncbi:hypothetical protein PSTG_20115, partial [Puccinia striiformis f. sp. tritici PST-78]